MKILYSVQGTGNGHITRARIMAKAFAEAGIEVDWIFSGRAPSDYFDMEAFGNFQSYRGLTFSIKQGRILFLKTAMTCNLRQLYKDIKAIKVDGYDFIINDFEPVSAWAAKRAGKKIIGISHQNSFFYDIPKQDSNPVIAWFMRNFAPVTQPIGLHWHHFDQPILPPLIEPSRYENHLTAKHYVVYLPFSDASDVTKILRKFSGFDFFIYQNITEAVDEDNIHHRPFSREGFQKDLHRCEGVICSAGFELPSEAIQLGKKILVMPLQGQMEQKSNARALKLLNYATVASSLDESIIEPWLATEKPDAIVYPDVAKALVEWLITSGGNNFNRLHDELWGNPAFQTSLLHKRVCVN